MKLLDVVDYPVKYLRFEHGGYFLLTLLLSILVLGCRLPPPFSFLFGIMRLIPKILLYVLVNFRNFDSTAMARVSI